MRFRRNAGPCSGNRSARDAVSLRPLSGGEGAARSRRWRVALDHSAAPSASSTSHQLAALDAELRCTAFCRYLMRGPRRGENPDEIYVTAASRRERRSPLADEAVVMRRTARGGSGAQARYDPHAEAEYTVRCGRYCHLREHRARRRRRNRRRSGNNHTRAASRLRAISRPRPSPSAYREDRVYGRGACHIPGRERGRALVRGLDRISTPVTSFRRVSSGVETLRTDVLVRLEDRCARVARARHDGRRTRSRNRDGQRDSSSPSRRILSSASVDYQTVMNR